MQTMLAVRQQNTWYLVLQTTCDFSWPLARLINHGLELRNVISTTRVTSAPVNRADQIHGNSARVAWYDQRLTPHHTTPHRTAPHHATPRHTTLHHATPHHTPHHTTWHVKWHGGACLMTLHHLQAARGADGISFLEDQASRIKLRQALSHQPL